jgi:hypothetical protein
MDLFFFVSCCSATPFAALWQLSPTLSHLPLVLCVLGYTAGSGWVDIDRSSMCARDDGTRAIAPFGANKDVAKHNKNNFICIAKRARLAQRRQ